MKTRKQLEKMLGNAERRTDEWIDKTRAELEWLCVRDGKGNMVPLMNVYDKEYYHDESVADIIEFTSTAVYEEDLDADKDGVYKVCTRRAVKRLRRLEQKFQEWNNKRFYLECVVELLHDDGTPYAYCENEVAFATSKLAELGISI